MFLKKVTSLAILILVLNLSFANQKEDSLLNVLSNQNDKDKIATYIRLFKSIYRSDVLKSEEYLLKAKKTEYQLIDSTCLVSPPTTW